MENKIYSIEKAGNYFIANKIENSINCIGVDEIREESKPVTNYANLKVYHGYTNGKLVFEIESNSGLTIIYE